MGVMNWPAMTNDQLEQVLVRCESNVAAIRAVQAAGLAEADRRQLPTADGARSLREWTAGRLDVSGDTARGLVRLARCGDPGVRGDVAAGEIGFDRAVAEAALVAAGASEPQRQAARGFDVAGVWRLAARRKAMTPADEREAWAARFCYFQPSLDGQAVDMRARFVGIDAQVVPTAVRQRMDVLPDPPGGRPIKPQRMADAVVSIAQDSLDGPPDGEYAAGPLATVMVDAELAAPTRGQAGAEVTGGPRIGPNTLAEILCSGRVEVNTTGTRPLAVGPTVHAIPPRLRRHVIHRDGGVCAVAGCDSRYRLQVHHIAPRSQGGTHHPANLTCLCWYHHHVVIHGAGYHIDPHSPPQRRRLRAPTEHRDRSPPPNRR